MSLVKANTYQDASGGSNAVFSGVASPPNSMGFRNRILNGDCRIDQRNAGASIAVTSSETYPVDRFAVRSDATGLSATMQRSTVAPSGFNNSLLVNVTTGGSIGASDRGFLRQFIEGFNVADFGFGTANAATITLSFWVRSSLTGTFSGALQNSAQDRSYVFTFSISVANTWEYKTITIAGSTSGTWVTDNGIGLRFWIDIGNGSSLRTSSTGSWQTSDVRGATGSVSLVANSGATFYITGVQLEAGTVASPFERRDYGRELMMCQRYYYKWLNDTGGDVYPFALQSYSASGAYGKYFDLPVTMRATPTCSSSGTFTGMNSSGGSTTAFSGVLVNAPTKNTIATNDTTGSSGMTAGQCQPMKVSNNAFIAASAEL